MSRRVLLVALVLTVTVQAQHVYEAIGYHSTWNSAIEAISTKGVVPLHKVKSVMEEQVSSSDAKKMAQSDSLPGIGRKGFFLGLVPYTSEENMCRQRSGKLDEFGVAIIGIKNRQSRVLKCHGSMCDGGCTTYSLGADGCKATETGTACTKAKEDILLPSEPKVLKLDVLCKDHTTLSDKVVKWLKSSREDKVIEKAMKASIKNPYKTTVFQTWLKMCPLTKFGVGANWGPATADNCHTEYILQEKMTKEAHAAGLMAYYRPMDVDKAEPPYDPATKKLLGEHAEKPVELGISVPFLDEDGNEYPIKKKVTRKYWLWPNKHLGATTMKNFARAKSFLRWTHFQCRGIKSFPLYEKAFKC